MPTEVSRRPAPGGTAVFEGPGFALRSRSEEALTRILATDAYSAAMAFVRGEVDVEGDLCAAIRYKTAHFARLTVQDGTGTLPLPALTA
ncbi:MAG: hypothetical protein C5B51_29255 [Terriglobia bacterium]|nr:MAG: hypothetical protein C5B51_29255 [Terriglobia bacterium]